MKAYSQDLRDRVIICYREGSRNLTQLAARFKIGYDTIRRWVKRYNETGDYSSRQGKVGGKKYKFSDKQAVLDFISSHPDASALEIRDTVAPGLHMNTFYDSLSRMKITFKKRAKIQRKR